MRKLLDGLVAINASTKADATRTREDRMKEQATRPGSFSPSTLSFAPIRKPGARRST